MYYVTSSLIVVKYYLKKNSKLAIIIKFQIVIKSDTNVIESQIHCFHKKLIARYFIDRNGVEVCQETQKRKVRVLHCYAN